MATQLQSQSSEQSSQVQEFASDGSFQQHYSKVRVEVTRQATETTPETRKRMPVAEKDALQELAALHKQTKRIDHQTKQRLEMMIFYYLCPISPLS
eukprot:scaffold117076_cov59-Cyclotella_meneghiniana.AAC.2